MAAAAGRRLLLQAAAEAPPRPQHLTRHQQSAPPQQPAWSPGALNVWLSQHTPIFGLRLWVLMGIAVGAAFVLVLLLLLLCLSRRRRRRDGLLGPNLYPAADTKVLKQHMQQPATPATPAKDIQEIVRHQQQMAAAPPPAAQMAKAEPQTPPPPPTFQQQRAQLPAMPAGSKRSTAASGLSATTSGGSERDLATPRSAGSGSMGPEVSHLGWGHWFTLRELEEATGGLTEENVIGEGGYGLSFSDFVFKSSPVTFLQSQPFKAHPSTEIDLGRNQPDHLLLARFQTERGRTWRFGGAGLDFSRALAL